MSCLPRHCVDRIVLNASYSLDTTLSVPVQRLILLEGNKCDGTVHMGPASRLELSDKREG